MSILQISYRNRRGFTVMDHEMNTKEMQETANFAAAPQAKSGEIKSPDVLLYSDLYKNA